ncbi:hypothetical protein L218DRAFT_417894 [Marasmius fiardii PR-910]|nr:hypothetical protein L218DRAFT_417894 [Marasmius fiardii PR-910]
MMPINCGPVTYPFVNDSGSTTLQEVLEYGADNFYTSPSVHTRFLHSAGEDSVCHAGHPYDHSRHFQTTSSNGASIRNITVTTATEAPCNYDPSYALEGFCESRNNKVDARERWLPLGQTDGEINNAPMTLFRPNVVNAHKTSSSSSAVTSLTDLYIGYYRYQSTFSDPIGIL